MSTTLMERCPVCTTPLGNSQKWQAAKSTSLRANSGKQNLLKQDFNRSGTAQSRLLNSGSQNLETEYIKQLQEQIYYLETECYHLREQLNTTSVALNRTLGDNRLHKAEQDRLDLQRSLIQTSSQFDQLTSEKHGLTIALDELRQKFDIEKQNLLDELEMLRRTRETFEQEKRARDQELRDARDRSRITSEELKSLQEKIRLLEIQVERQVNEITSLNDELRHGKIETNNLKRSLNDYQLIAREKDRLQENIFELERENKNLKDELQSQDARYNEAELLQNKLASEKGALMKEISRLEKLAKDFERDLEQLRQALQDRTDVLHAKDKELNALRKKEQTLRSTFESIQTKYDADLSRMKILEDQIKQLQRQLNIETQNSAATKRELNEYQLRNTRLQDENNVLQRDKNHLTNHITELQDQVRNEKSLSNTLRSEIQDLEDRVKEIDRLKGLEDLIQSQRWGDISQMAQTMQSVSRTMATATSPTRSRKRLELQ